ncbi:major facilitator superfamily domain-containing protein [Halteromyces radiatus]|uniref:major facilitator superfamily domain-containing protein n=1 Tax=Halteromyces radiatus TaxID=101107 RepID=UPI002220A6C2|nr:major facilitator superfamily domain-containing protein [Halteromyces radiatus]KAI8089813.1 major facilitator superfamily domain-containing protein [Halteromyces radiatus]
MNHREDDDSHKNYINDNELTVVASPFSHHQLSSESHDLEKLSTINTVHHHIESGGHHVERLDTTITNVDVASVIEPIDVEYYDDIPDGGYGWFVAIAGFLLNFIMFGTASIWGVFSKAYATGILEGKTTTVALMGVGSTSLACLNLMTPFNPMLARFGIHVVMVIGSVLMSLGIILAGFSYEIWHLYLTQGVLFGFGASLVYMSVVAVIPQWFTTKRGAAMGIASAGTGIGGLSLSPMASSLIAKYGIAWAYRIIGLMAFGICMVATALIRTRIPKPPMNQKIKSPIKLYMLKDINFVIWLFGVVISLAGYFVPLYYLPKYGASIGLDDSTTSNLLGIACALNAVGRIVLGWVADRIGRLNMYIISCTVAGLLCCILWKFATSYHTLLAFSITWGFVCGLYFALAPPITGTIVGIEKISPGLSILFVASSIASVGPPIASAIQSSTPGESYIGVQMFSGAIYLFGALICFGLKIKMTKSIFSFI